jgi:phage shock protein PspC (stress-responsive transcriptional regulator)
MQRLSVTARLNRSTLQFEDSAFDRLQAYLAEASRTLEGNPDRDEIMSDLEQAVANQCAARLRPEQSIVVTLAEMQPALDEIGSVQVPGTAGGPSQATQDTTRALQQVSEGALISGVCQGLARYMRLDVSMLRVVAVLLLLATGGGMILIYLALMLLLPYAPLERGGPPLRKLPAKSRALVEFLRSKLSTVTS